MGRALSLSRAEVGARDGCIEWAVDWAADDASGADARGGAAALASVRVRAPRVAVAEGDELFNWYGNAGYDADTPAEWEAAHMRFVTSYGFSPWFDEGPS